MFSIRKKNNTFPFNGISKNKEKKNFNKNLIAKQKLIAIKWQLKKIKIKKNLFNVFPFSFKFKKQ